MTPFVSYFLACFTMTLLWMMLILACAAIIVSIAHLGSLAMDTEPIPKSDMRRAGRMIARGIVGLLFTIPSLQALYTFWGQW